MPAPQASAQVSIQFAAGSPQGRDTISYEQLQKMLDHVQNYIDINFTDIGNKLADDALKIHRGEKDA